MKPIIAFIITFVIGVTLSISYAFIEQSGRLERWSRLPSPPAKPSELVFGDFGDLYVLSEDGRFFTCEYPNQQGCWTLSTPPPPPEPDPYLSDCIKYSFHIMDPPFVVVQQVEWRACHIEGWGLERYALSDNGEIWQWSHGTIGQATILIILLGFCVSSVFGLLVALTVLLLGRRSIRLQDGS